MSPNSSTTAPLCLACSSSLPPRLWKRSQQGADAVQSGHTSASAVGGGSDSELLFLTRCCGRPICPSCLTANPRLARYNPCLACLGGVGAVGRTEKMQGLHPVASNLDGAVRDEDVFVLGDEDEDEDEEAARAPGMVSSPSEGTGPLELDNRLGPCADPEKRDEPTDSNQGSPGRYYIRQDDTLLGISLRLGVDGRTLCKLNDLPPSTLRTTPHLLHTRTFLVLPQSHSQQRQATNGVTPEEEVQRTRVRAQVALQQVTKEMDGGIAQAYVALAEDGDSESDVASLKAEKEKESRRVARTLEERALDRYLDDDEWERRERAEGRGVHIQRLPIRGSEEKASWWRSGL